MFLYYPLTPAPRGKVDVAFFVFLPSLYENTLYIMLFRLFWVTAFSSLCFEIIAEKRKFDKKAKVSSDQETAQSKNRDGSKKTYRKPSEQLFSNRRPLCYPNLTKNMKTYIRCKQHKISTPNIRKTCPCNVYPLEPHFYIAKLGYAGVYLFFLFLLQNINFYGGSNVYLQSIF